METSEIIAILEHYAKGGAVEVRRYGEDEWNLVTSPIWNFSSYTYRPAQGTKREESTDEP